MNVFIVDDEPAARRILRDCCEKEPDLDVVGEFDNADAAVEAIERSPPDLVFLDIALGTKSGIDVARALDADAPEIVFVTAYDRYAIEAFDVGAIDYLLKPFDEARFRESAVPRRRPPTDTPRSRRCSTSWGSGTARPRASAPVSWSISARACRWSTSSASRRPRPIGTT